MVDPRLYTEESFVFLKAGQPEELLSADELLERLTTILQAHPDELPSEVAAIATPTDQARYVMGNYCELTLGADQFIQWYAIRLEKE